MPLDLTKDELCALRAILSFHIETDPDTFGDVPKDWPYDFAALQSLNKKVNPTWPSTL